MMTFSFAGMTLPHIDQDEGTMLVWIYHKV